MSETKASPRRRFDTLGLIAFLILLSFLVMLISGVVMFLAPSGRIERETGWLLLGLGREGWQTLHLTFSVLFIIFGFAHLFSNRRGLVNHLKDRKTRHVTLKWEAVIAVGVTIWLLVSAVLSLPPANYLHDMNEHFRKTFWAGEQSQRPGESPASSKESSGSEAPTDAKALPPGHPPINPGEDCSACHRK